MRVKIRGVEYENARAAAKSLKVSVAAIYKGLSRGNPDGIGMGRVNTKGRLSGNRTPVKLFHYQWPSISHAAKDLGINRKRLSLLIRSGDLAPVAIAVMGIDARVANQRMKREQRGTE